MTTPLPFRSSTPSRKPAIAPARRTLSIDEAAHVLGIGRKAAYAAAAAGRLPILRFGRKLRVPVPALEEMLRTAQLSTNGDAGVEPRR